MDPCPNPGTVASADDEEEKVRSFQSHVAAPISDSSALNQTPAESETVDTPVR